MTTPLRRVTLVSPYALSVPGGVQEQVLAMSRELERRGVGVYVVAPDADDDQVYDTPARVERFGRLVSVAANGSRAPLTLSGAASRAAFARISRFDPDVVHFHEPFAPRLGYQTLRSHAFAAVGTFHRSGEGPAVSLAAPWLRRWARSLDASAAVSEQAAHTARRSCGLEPVRLFNGFETERFIEFPRERQDVTTLVVVGRLEERKGVATAIDALRAHNERGAPPWRLVVVGDGPERAALEARAGSAAVLFTGRVSDEEKRRWYRRADVVVAPATRGESFGLILLEAMASETPVVASDIPGYREAAQGHAGLFQAGSATELEKAVDLVLMRGDDGALAAAREHAGHWSMAHLVDRYLELYEFARRDFSALD